MDISKIQSELRQFAHERDWNEFHSPKNLAAALTVEAAELLEIFQWSNSDGWDEIGQVGNVDEHVVQEVADILNYLIRFADIAGIDLEKAALDKIVVNAEKYPVELSKGNATKYNRRPE